MKKSKKILICILSVLCLLLSLLIYALNAANKGRPENVQYPPSTLTKSIFDSQNITYMEQGYLNETYSLVNLPYTIDLPSAEIADVGTGTVYYVPGRVYIYLAEILKTESEVSYIKEEFGKAVMIDSWEEKSILQNYYEDEGYLNGFTVRYLVDSLAVTNGRETGHAYMTAYRLITDNAYDHDIFISIATLTESSLNYAGCKEWMDGIIGTLRYSKDLAESIEKGKKQQSAMQQELIEKLVPKKEQEEEAETDIILKNVNVTLDKDYEGALITFEWTKEDANVTVLLKDVDGNRYTPSTNSNHKAVFNMIRLQKGEWTFEVYGDYGNCSVHLYERDKYGRISSVGPEGTGITDRTPQQEDNKAQAPSDGIKTGQSLVTVTQDEGNGSENAASSVVAESETSESGEQE